MIADPNVVEFRNEHKPWVGLLLTMTGLAVIILPSVVPGFEDVPLWVQLLTMLMCLIPGLWMLVGLYVHPFDRMRGTVTTAWSLLIPFKSGERSTSDFRTLVISKERQTVSRRKATPTRTQVNETRTFFLYPVKLICEDDPPERDLVDLIDGDEGIIDSVANLRTFGMKMNELEKVRKASGRASLTLGKPANHTKAHEMATRIAGFLDLRLCDLA